MITELSLNISQQVPTNPYRSHKSKAMIRMRRKDINLSEEKNLSKGKERYDKINSDP